MWGYEVIWISADEVHATAVYLCETSLPEGIIFPLLKIHDIMNAVIVILVH